MSVGETLAAERRKQGKSLADVVAATNIMSRLLDALENGRLDELPSPVYVRGYIQSYAQFLGLPAAPLVDEYQQDLGSGKPRSRLEDVPERAVVQTHDQMHLVPLRTWLTIVAALVAIGLTLWLVGTFTSNRTPPPPIPPATTTGTVEPTDTVPGVTTDTVPATSTTNPAETTAAPTAGAPFVLTVSVAKGAASWLRVTVDGRSAYEGTLAGSATKEWTVTKTAEVRIGKEDAVTVKRDGEIVKPTASGGIAIATMSTTK